MKPGLVPLPGFTAQSDNQVSRRSAGRQRSRPCEPRASRTASYLSPPLSLEVRGIRVRRARRPPGRPDSLMRTVRAEVAVSPTRFRRRLSRPSVRSRRRWPAPKPLRQIRRRMPVQQRGLEGAFSSDSSTRLRAVLCLTEFLTETESYVIRFRRHQNAVHDGAIACARQGGFRSASTLPDEGADQDEHPMPTTERPMRPARCPTTGSAPNGLALRLDVVSSRFCGS